MSLITAMLIQSHNTVCLQEGPDPSGMFAGRIAIIKGWDNRPQVVVSSEFIYPTGEEAVSAMSAVVGKIKEADLIKQAYEKSATLRGGAKG